MTVISKFVLKRGLLDLQRAWACAVLFFFFSSNLVFQTLLAD